MVSGGWTPLLGSWYCIVHVLQLDLKNDSIQCNLVWCMITSAREVFICENLDIIIFSFNLTHHRIIFMHF